MIRSTTNGVLKSYRYSLQSSTNRLNSARDTVLTGRNFNSFAEDPTTAARSFQLRSTLQRTTAQHSVGQSVVSKYEVAWSTLDSVISDVSNAKSDSALTAILNGSNDTTGGGRTALGQELTQLAGSILQAMNAKYGDNFVFAGADGLNIPLTMDENGNVFYRGIDVTSGDQAALDYLVDNEKKYADLGLGMQEDENGHIIDSSAFNVALHSITYLGYGKDEDNDPKNIVSIIHRMGQLLEGCDENGNFQGNDEEEFRRLAGKFDDAAGIILGGFTNCGEKEGSLSGLSLEEIFQELIAPAGKPTISGVVCGHCSPSMSLPMGRLFKMDAAAGTFGPVEE